MAWKKGKTSSLQGMRRLLIVQVDEEGEKKELPKELESVEGDREPIKVSPDTTSETIRKRRGGQEAKEDSETISTHTLERTGKAAAEALQMAAEGYGGRQEANEDSASAPISKATQMSSLMQELAEMAKGALNAVNAKCRTRQKTRRTKKK
jgi:hypothetical protein